MIPLWSNFTIFAIFHNSNDLSLGHSGVSSHNFTMFFQDISRYFQIFVWFSTPPFYIFFCAILTICVFFYLSVFHISFGNLFVCSFFFLHSFHLPSFRKFASFANLSICFFFNSSFFHISFGNLFICSFSICLPFSILFIWLRSAILFICYDSWWRLTCPSLNIWWENLEKSAINSFKRGRKQLLGCPAAKIHILSQFI